jgi:hypothetical protein
MELSPLTGLICTGIDSKASDVLVDGDYNKISVIEAIGYSLSDPFTNVSEYNSNTCGFSFELMLLCSTILSSHAKGFGGCSLFTFLEHLCRELDVNASYEKDLPTVNYDEAKKFKVAFENFRVPFLSPSTTDSWNVDFVHSLKTIAPSTEFDLGISYPSMKISSRGDFLITRWDEKAASNIPTEPIIVGQCKLRSKNLGQNIFQAEIIPSFKDFKECKLFIVTGRGIANMEKYSAEGYYIWKMFRSSAGNLFLKAINGKQDKSAEKHVIAMGLDELCSASERSPALFDYETQVAKTDPGTKRKLSENTQKPKRIR